MTDSFNLSVPGCTRALRDNYMPRGEMALMQQEAIRQGVYDKLCVCQ